MMPARPPQSSASSEAIPVRIGQTAAINATPSDAKRPGRIDPTCFSASVLDIPSRRHNKAQRSTEEECTKSELNKAHRLSSQANERLHNPTKQTIQAKLSLHSDQTYAILARFDDRLVLDGLVTEIEIARSIVGAILAKRSREDTRHLDPGVRMLEHFSPRTRLKQKDPRIAVIGQDVGRTCTDGAIHFQFPNP